jgi:phosphatidylethanolamine/phosphatidyl-N-methylethanolamine N-methyltransferase
MNQKDHFFYKHYQQIVNGKNIVGYITGKLHNKLESFHSLDNAMDSILEVGAGNSEHFSYVRSGFKRYVELDVRSELQKEKQALQPRTSREAVVGNCEDLHMFEDCEFDRLIATCVLVHLEKPEAALLEWKRVVRENGIVSIWVALEPSIFLRIAQNFTTKKQTEKLGFDWQKIHYREHINHYPRLRMLLDEVFQGCKISRKRFPFSILPWDFNLVEIWQIQVRKNL